MNSEVINLVVNNKSVGQKGLTVAAWLASIYPNVIISNTTSHQYFNIVLTQNPNLIGKDPLALSKTLYLLRPEYLSYSKQSATNGFSVFKKHKYRFFIPMLYDYCITNDTNYGLSIGFYDSPYRNNIKYFKNFLKINNNIRKVSILGKASNYIDLRNLGIEIEEHLNKDEFFNSITHLFYPKSETFLDPWPTVLEEAVHCNKQIIIPESKRDFVDGIDDICGCILYHNEFDGKYYDNSSSYINRFNYTKYYDALISHQFNTDCYDNEVKTLKEWIETNDLLRS